MGVRIALGASPADIICLVLGEGLWITGAGIVLGVALGITMAKVGEYFLFGVRRYDVLSYGPVVTLFASAVLACYVPARRATRVDPLVTLRDA
jgi:putative ABC transport system permease protein